MRRRRLLALSGALLGAACNHPTRESAPVAPGRYVLVAANGRRLPAVVDSSGREFGAVLADTLVLDGRGGAVRALTFRRVDRVFRTDVVSRSRGELAYREWPGGRIELGRFDPCPLNAICVTNDTGTVRGDRLELVSHHYGERPRLTFVRLPD